MDERNELRSIPLLAVLSWLGYEGFKPRKGGTEWAGKCPIHKPKNNTTAFSFDHTGRFNCFGCAAHGKGAIDLVMQVEGLAFKEAVAWLTERKGLPMPQLPAPSPNASQEPNSSVSEATENQPRSFTYEKFYQPCDWLAQRGFTIDTLARYGVGLYNNPQRTSKYKGKVMIRVQRMDGATVAYLARDIRTKDERGSDPKYLFPAGFAKHLELWGAWQLAEKGRTFKTIYLVESPFSVMHFHQLGLPAVSPFGWPVSVQQAETIGQLARACVYLPDADKYEQAGQYAGLLARYVWVKLPHLPDGITDPEQLTLEQILALT
jgi:DNA primase